MIAKSTAVRAPRCLMTAVCEAVPDRSASVRPGHDLPLTGGRWHLIHSVRTLANRWTTQERSGDARGSVWNAIADALPARGSVWLLTPRLSECMTLSKGWDELGRGELRIPGVTASAEEREGETDDSDERTTGYVAVGHSAELLIGSFAGVSLNIVSAANYQPGSLHELFSRRGEDEVAGMCVQTAAGRYGPTPAIVATALHRWYTALIDTWVKHKVGPWRHTAGQLAQSAGRQFYGPSPTVPTQAADVRAMERDACYGGRAEVFCVAPHLTRNVSPYEVGLTTSAGACYPITGRVHRLDIRSCYPSILGNGLAPERLLSVQRGECSVDLIDTDGDVVPLARVLIQTDEEAYPCRVLRRGRSIEVPTAMSGVPQVELQYARTIFPCGRFWTCLCGDELIDAVRRGRVVACSDVAHYSVTDKIVPFIRNLYERRKSAERAGNEDRSSLWKMLSNAYAGKSAAKGSRWVTCPKVGAPAAFAVWHETDADTGLAIKYRSIGWYVQREVTHPDNPRSHPILWAWLTSRARLKLWQIIKRAGLQNVVQCDTDGLYVNEEGLKHLQGVPDLFGGEWGQLRLVSSHDSFRAWGPKHYVCDGEWTMAGLPDGWTLNDEGGCDTRRVSYDCQPAADDGVFRGHSLKFSVRPTHSGERRSWPEECGPTEPHWLPVIHHPPAMDPPEEWWEPEEGR